MPLSDGSTLYRGNRRNSWLVGFPTSPGLGGWRGWLPKTRIRFLRYPLRVEGDATTSDDALVFNLRNRKKKERKYATMGDDEHPGDVFSIPDLWALSKCFVGVEEHSGFLFSQLQLDDINQLLPNSAKTAEVDDVFFSIPDMSFGSSDPLPTPTASANSALEAPRDNGVEDDVWAFLEEDPVKEAHYQSWDAFNTESFSEPPTAYITEAGTEIFDTSVAADDDLLRIHNTEYVVVDSIVYCASILALGLGRSSIFFKWNEEKLSFVPTLPRMRISGYTGDSLDGLVAVFSECGNTTRYLQKFVDKAYTRSLSPGRIALADAISTLLALIQSRLASSASELRSILQLQVLFRPAHSILTCFKRIVVNVLATRSDEAMLSTLFEEVQLLEHRTDSLRDILLEILSRVSQPWLEFTREWLGLQREVGLPLTKEGSGKSFVRVDNREWLDEHGLELQEPDYELDYDKVPSFILPNDARSMFEVGKSLRFLRLHHAEHPLARADVVASAMPPSLEWQFSWQNIAQLEAKALQYEKDLITTIRTFTKSSPTMDSLGHDKESHDDDFKLDFFGKPEEDMQAHVMASIAAFGQMPVEGGEPDRLSNILNTYLTSDGEPAKDDNAILSPPISLMPLLSFGPVISAQARIVNGTCMRLFFNSHKLREHLTLQRNFHLLGDGVFSSRLSHALFDPELESAERHRGVARSGGMMGLRLGGRDTWPPASSELRLALMGVLTDSYTSNQPLDKARITGYVDRRDSLPGDLSFAVRDMSHEEIEKCINPDSIEALDFLRLSYKPPPALEAVITPLILFKYDQLFKLLLRVVRMLYVVSTLFRDAKGRTSPCQGTDFIAQRFRIEAHHFVSSVSGYFFDTGIEATWRIFERKLDEIETRINDDEGITLGQNEGLDKLRDYHERVLDRVLFALLLRKRQQPVLKLLEEIFTLILQFSSHTRQRVSGMKNEVGSDGEVKEIYLQFRKNISVFITVCKGLSEKKGYGDKKFMDTQGSEQGLFDGDDLAEENTIMQLLTRLEMSDYYSKPVDV
ncbi:hypothetical protein B7494_g6116 [Chlorociboria aeruginascens]|nr:hypothetical protein B7494_g6116 [Chlorociboria aeruginascens]